MLRGRRHVVGLATLFNVSTMMLLRLRCAEGRGEGGGVTATFAAAQTFIIGGGSSPTCRTKRPDTPVYSSRMNGVLEFPLPTTSNDSLCHVADTL